MHIATYNRLMNEADGATGLVAGGGERSAVGQPAEQTAVTEQGDSGGSDVSQLYDLAGDSTSGGGVDTDGDQGEQAEAYEVPWGDDFFENDALRDMLSGHAKAAGLPAGEVGRFLNNVAASIREDELRAFQADDAALKGDWGKDYEHNMAEAKAFARRLGERSGVSVEEIGKAFANPTGFRLLHAMSKAMGEGGIKGAERGVNAADEAKAMLSDPSHRYYEAIGNPSHPKWTEANAYYNRLVGLRE